jgi:hypothetical protein
MHKLSPAIYNLPPAKSNEGSYLTPVLLGEGDLEGEVDNQPQNLIIWIGLCSFSSKWYKKMSNITGQRCILADEV